MVEKKLNTNRRIALFAGLTVSVMALFFNFYEPWAPIGSDRILDGKFNTPAATSVWSGWNEWSRRTPTDGSRNSPGVVLNTASNRQTVLRMIIDDITDVPAFRVSLRATAKGIVRGKESYFLPRAVFFYRDAQSKSLFHIPHGIMLIQKDRGWRTYTGFFPVPDGATEARFYIQNLGDAGVMRVDDLSVVPVQKRPSAPWAKGLFSALWAIALGVCLFRLRLWHRPYGWIISILLILILIGIILPEPLLNNTLKKTAQTGKTLILKKSQPPTSIQNPDPPLPADQSKLIQKTIIVPPETPMENAHLIGHLILFSLLAFFSALSWLSSPPSLKRAGELFAGLLFFAAATEVLQFIPIGRSANLKDLSTDTLGMGGAVILVLIFRSVQHLWKQKMSGTHTPPPPTHSQAG